MYNPLGGDVQLLDYINFNRGPLKKQIHVGVKVHVKSYLHIFARNTLLMFLTVLISVIFLKLMICLKSIM